MAIGDRLFLRRTVTYAIREESIDQFLDIGTGLPTADNTHEVAQALDPKTRVVYVDNDPLVSVHARALLVGDIAESPRFVGEALREVDKVWAAARQTLDFDKPILLTLMGTLGHFPHEEALRLVRAYMDALPIGSLLVVCDGAFPQEGGATPDANALEGMRLWQEHVAQPYIMRTVPEFTAYFEGLEQVEPGVVSMCHWRPEPSEVGTLRDLPQHAGLAKKV